MSNGRRLNFALGGPLPVSVQGLSGSAHRFLITHVWDTRHTSLQPGRAPARRGHLGPSSISLYRAIDQVFYTHSRHGNCAHRTLEGTKPVAHRREPHAPPPDVEPYGWMYPITKPGTVALGSPDDCKLRSTGGRNSRMLSLTRQRATTAIVSRGETWVSSHVFDYRVARLRL